MSTSNTWQAITKIEPPLRNTQSLTLWDSKQKRTLLFTINEKILSVWVLKNNTWEFLNKTTYTEKITLSNRTITGTYTDKCVLFLLNKDDNYSLQAFEFENDFKEVTIDASVINFNDERIKACYSIKDKMVYLATIYDLYKLGEDNIITHLFKFPNFMTSITYDYHKDLILIAGDSGIFTYQDNNLVPVIEKPEKWYWGGTDLVILPEKNKYFGIVYQGQCSAYEIDTEKKTATEKDSITMFGGSMVYDENINKVIAVVKENQITAIYSYDITENKWIRISPEFPFAFFSLQSKERLLLIEPEQNEIYAYKNGWNLLHKSIEKVNLKEPFWSSAISIDDHNREVYALNEDFQLVKINADHSAEVLTSNSLSKRSKYSINYTDQGVVVFGGEDEHGKVLDETWIAEDGKWTESTGKGPTKRSAHKTISPDNNVVFLFGGDGPRKDCTDVWCFNGKKWKVIAKEAMKIGIVAYDQETQNILGLGGSTQALYVWDSTEWKSILEFESIDENTYGHSYGYDPISRSLVGINGGGNNQTFSMSIGDILDQCEKEMYKKNIN